MTIIDAHGHFWNVDKLRYPWIAQGSLFDRSFSLQDYLRSSTAAHAVIDGMIFVEAGFAVQRSFVEGVREVGRRGLLFELCLKHHQVAETLELPRQCPDVSLALDHCAKPDVCKGEREPWLAQIRQLAGLPNIVCKIRI